MDEPNTYWGNVLWSDDTKTELFANNDERYIWKSKARLSNLRTLHWVVVALCSGTILLTVVHCIKRMI